ncbi:hypothetical protein JCGZ_10901 [Jatropha curcas]|uniref:AP2/ERF domain-containing protein n=1 Tax=Jatropha curcas TaxID=180498 RepID=A0A067KEP4_JATCU|nr:hypothetical protein JCGZ_10901 [Jatropha curcas]
MEFDNGSIPISSICRFPPEVVMKKRKAGRTKFKETRHPFYRGVRRRNGNKWVCEVREPNKNKSRIWLGTFPTPEMAARAHDIAALALRGDLAILNFPDSASVLPRPKSSSAKDIKRVVRAFVSTTPSVSPSSSSCSYMSTTSQPYLVDHRSNDEFESCYNETREVSESNALFMDEEALFNMPVLLDSLAEGLILTPPGIQSGIHWNEMAFDDMELTLWEP